MRSWAAIALLAIVAVGCNPTSGAKPERHVFLIVMENHTPEQALGGPFLASLRDKYRSAENYYAITHPSLPNYLAMTSGTTWDIRDDSYHELPSGKDLGAQLTAAGVSWRAYMEGFDPSAGCLDSPVPYDPGHNPFAFYGGKCPPNVVPLTALKSDLAGGTPRFTWITPDRCHDTHDCEVSVGDDWLRGQVGDIMASDAWKSNGVLFITYDEDDMSADNRVVMLAIAPGMSSGKSTRSYNHYSLLATLEALLGVGRLGEAANAKLMSDLIS
jgi:phosphatidylinositol-3-phosphatase